MKPVTPDEVREYLGLEIPFAPDAITAAYKKAQFREHPDRSKQPNAHDRYIRLTEVYTACQNNQTWHIGYSGPRVHPGRGGCPLCGRPTRNGDPLCPVCAMTIAGVNGIVELIMPGANDSLTEFFGSVFNDVFETRKFKPRTKKDRHFGSEPRAGKTTRQRRAHD